MDKTDHLNFVSHEVTISKQTNKQKLQTNSITQANNFIATF